jgi:hypothetical protein
LASPTPHARAWPDTLTWSIGGERAGEISLAAQANGVRLLYSLTGRDGTKSSIDELVPFTYTATMFGGRRERLQRERKRK